jgi:hypothetical protein
VSGTGAYVLSREQPEFPWDRDRDRVVATTGDWVEAQRLLLESRHGHRPRNAPRLRLTGTHPSHAWVNRRCVRCDGWDNGSYGSQMPCGYDHRGLPLVTIVANELAARGVTDWIYRPSDRGEDGEVA